VKASRRLSSSCSSASVTNVMALFGVTKVLALVT
jgi:hypothetical protein